MNTKYTKWQQIDQMAIKYIYHHLQWQDLQKFTQIRIFGLKMCHLATLCLPTYTGNVLKYLDKKVSKMLDSLEPKRPQGAIFQWLND
jgi:hypothetical protein